MSHILIGIIYVFYEKVLFLYVLAILNWHSNLDTYLKLINKINLTIYIK